MNRGVRKLLLAQSHLSSPHTCCPNIRTKPKHGPHFTSQGPPVLLTGGIISPTFPVSSYGTSSCFSLGAQGSRGLQGGGGGGEVHLLPAETLCQLPRACLDAVLDHRAGRVPGLPVLGGLPAAPQPAAALRLRGAHLRRGGELPAPHDVPCQEGQPHGDRSGRVSQHDRREVQLRDGRHGAGVRRRRPARVVTQSPASPQPCSEPPRSPAVGPAIKLPRAPLPCREGAIKGTVCIDGLRAASIFTYTYVRGTYGA